MCLDWHLLPLQISHKKLLTGSNCKSFFIKPIIDIKQQQLKYCPNRKYHRWELAYSHWLDLQDYLSLKCCSSRSAEDFKVSSSESVNTVFPEFSLPDLRPERLSSLTLNRISTSFLLPIFHQFHFCVDNPGPAAHLVTSHHNLCLCPLRETFSFLTSLDRRSRRSRRFRRFRRSRWSLSISRSRVRSDEVLV